MSNDKRIDAWRQRRQQAARDHRGDWLDRADDAGIEGVEVVASNAPSQNEVEDHSDNLTSGVQNPLKAARDRANVFLAEQEQDAEPVGSSADAATGSTASQAKDGDRPGVSGSHDNEPAEPQDTAHSRSDRFSENGDKVLPVNRGLPNDRTISEAHQFAQARRSRITRGRRLRFLAIIGIPLALFAFYSLVITRPLYEATSVFIVKPAHSETAAPGAALGLGGPSSSLSEEYQIREFLTSRTAMRSMEKKFGFLAHSAETSDFLTRPGGLFVSSDPLAFFRRRVDVTVNMQEGLATLHVKAGTREDAVRFTDGLLDLARERLASITRQLNEDQIVSLEAEVKQARLAVNEAGAALGRVQQARGEVDPVLATNGIYQIIADLELKQTGLEAQRDGLKLNGLGRSPLLPRLNAQINTLKRQVEEQRGRLTGSGANTVQRSILVLERARTQKQLAETTLAAALTTLEQARLEALKQRQYLVLVAPPSSPDAPNVWMGAIKFSWLILLVALIGGAFYLWKMKAEAIEDE